MTKHTYRQVTPEDIETDDFGRVTDTELRLYFGADKSEAIPALVHQDWLIDNDGAALLWDLLYIREEKPVELSELIPDKTHLVHDVKKGIERIASIYPTAFDLYDEPLERVAYEVIRVVEQACIQVKREETSASVSDACDDAKSESASMVGLGSSHSDSPADSDGWISGNNCQLRPDELVRVRFNDGTCSKPVRVSAVTWNAIDYEDLSQLVTHWKPAGKEWILHDGSTGRPKTPNRVDVIYRDGQYIEDHDGHTDYFWTEYEMHPETDVLWYRVIKEPEELTKRLKAGELKSHNREPLEVRMRVRSHDSIDFTDVPSLDKNAVLFREVIKPELKELPDCEGVWLETTSEIQVPARVKYVNGYWKREGFAKWFLCPKGQWLFLDPIIKQAIGDAE